jgi:hypothetical protein
MRSKSFLQLPKQVQSFARERHLEWFRVIESAREAQLLCLAAGLGLPLTGQSPLELGSLLLSHGAPNIFPKWVDHRLENVPPDYPLECSASPE